MNSYRCAIAVLTATLLSGCASNIKVFDAVGKLQDGFPVNSAVLVNVTRETSFKLKNPADMDKYDTLCKQKIVSSDISFLPIGEVYFVKFDPAKLGKSEFALEFSDSGLVKKVSVNSDATAGVDSVAGFLEKVLPFYKAPEEAASATDDAARAVGGGETTEDLRKKHCIKVGTKVISVVRQEISG